MYVLSCSSVSSMRGSRGGLGRGGGHKFKFIDFTYLVNLPKKGLESPPSPGKHNYPLDPLPGKIFWIHACALVTCR